MFTRRPVCIDSLCADKHERRWVPMLPADPVTFNFLQTLLLARTVNPVLSYGLLCLGQYLFNRIQSALDPCIHCHVKLNSMIRLRIVSLSKPCPCSQPQQGNDQPASVAIVK